MYAFYHEHLELTRQTPVPERKTGLGNISASPRPVVQIGSSVHLKPVCASDNLARQHDKDDQEDDPAAAAAATESPPQSESALHPVEQSIQQKQLEQALQATLTLTHVKPLE